MAFMFENLQVYQKAVDFAERVCVIIERSQRGLRSQHWLAPALSTAPLGGTTTSYDV